MVWSIFPIAEYIDKNLSWEGHLGGTISGFIVAAIFRNKGPQKPSEKCTSEDEELEESEDEELEESENEKKNEVGE